MKILKNLLKPDKSYNKKVHEKISPEKLLKPVIITLLVIFVLSWITYIYI